MGFFNRIRFLGLGLGLVLGLHFFLIGHFVESYPSWGDDWGFILLFDTQLSDVFYSFSSYLIPFHGGIHANLWAKIYVIFSSFFVSDFSYVGVIWVANLLLLPILYCFGRYVRLMGHSAWHVLGIALLLYSLKGQVDNFGFIGVFQHGATVSMVVLISYLMTVQKRYLAGVLIANVSLLMISTESLGILFISNVLLGISRHRFRYYLWVLSVLTVILYYWGIQISSGILGIQGGAIHVNLGIIPAIFIFLGGIISRIWVALGVGILCCWVLLYPMFRSIKTVFKAGNEQRLFLPMIFFSMATIGLLIQLGRGVDASGAISFGVLLAPRFSLYHVIPLVLLYLGILEYRSPLSLRLQGLMLLGALGFYGLNLWTQLPLLEAEQRRILCDAYVMKTQQTCLSYPMGSSDANRIVGKSWYAWPDFSTITALNKQSPVFYTRKEEGEITQLRCLTRIDSPFFALLVGNKRYVVSGHSISGDAFQIDLNRVQLAQIGAFKVVQLSR
jgi:hypothetical protein